ncbi:hypothetical protein Pst134EA_026003 [Puccinia striiformis f. sp. tritici]|uniref:hypothetical protein n=1 Tax=Puccinia striiformis f. sp. tritici TaxID=168172 RepID=UPI0020077D80|nr:hypothetical protein Pst134EA_026003 [Puccinia striiformis f. sp. tritici]KAH9444199.1 hypothetical protein Pst134EB_026578 [Puccinia striiformis f. sp. tritici]KAH9452067.1 hypothetical protein Pst134EA_026003 [Puccinia striiformis f. sp. tritici]
MSGRQPPSGYLNATSKMAESLAEQDISDPTVLKTYFLQAIANATENSNHSNPYYVAAHHIHSLMDLRAPLTAVSIVDETGPLPAWIVVLTSIFLILFAIQMILSVFCLVLLSKTENFWLVRVSKIGLLVLNTRTVCLIMASLFSACLSADLVAFFLAIFQVTGADSRFLILSIEWLPCFLAGWVFLWGLGSGVFEAAYESGLPMVIHKASAWGFNFVAVMLPIFMTISQMFNFIMAHNNMVDAINVGSSIEANLKREGLSYDADHFNATSDILPKLIPIKNIIPHEIKLANYLLSGQMMWIAWAVVLFVLTIPLVTLHLKTLKDTIRKIASECEIDLDQSALTIFEHQAAEDEPFSGPNLSSASAKQQKSTDLLKSFRKERRANKISLAIFLSYLSVYLLLCIANKATSSMNQSDHGARSAIAFLIAGKACAAILGLLLTTQFYRKIRSGSKEALAQGTGSAFGAGMQFHKEVSMIIEDAALRRVGGSSTSNYAKYGEW